MAYKISFLEVGAPNNFCDNDNYLEWNILYGLFGKHILMASNKAPITIEEIRKELYIHLHIVCTNKEVEVALKNLEKNKSVKLKKVKTPYNQSLITSRPMVVVDAYPTW